MKKFYSVVTFRRRDDRYKPLRTEMGLSYMLGGGLEPPCLSAYAPQTYVSAISPPERTRGTQLVSRTIFPASVS
jgi:hypothetical protein